MDRLPCRRRSKRLAWSPALVLAPSILAAAVLPASDAGADETAHALVVTVRTRGDAGAVFCALWPDPEGYPVDRTRATHEGVDRSIRSGRARIRFEAVADGDHAVACFHDENDNGTLDTGWLGIPSEGTGASNDARGLMGPPPWDGARFRIEAGRPSALDVEIAY